MRDGLGVGKTSVSYGPAVAVATREFGLFINPFQFYHSYLWSYMFLIGLGLGSLAWLMLQYLTGGAWGVVAFSGLVDCAECGDVVLGES